MANSNRWFAIINPTSGNGSSKQKWPLIEALLNASNFDFDFAYTEHENHSSELIQQAIRIVTFLRTTNFLTPLLERKILI